MKPLHKQCPRRRLPAHLLLHRPLPAVLPHLHRSPWVDAHSGLGNLSALSMQVVPGYAEECPLGSLLFCL